MPITLPIQRDDKDTTKEEQSQANIMLGVHSLSKLNLPVGDLIGVVAAIMLTLAETHPREMRRALNERVLREGFSGISLLEYLRRIKEG